MKNTIVTFIKDWFGLIAIVVAAVSGLGFTFSPPWARASDVTAMRQELLDVQKDMKTLNCTTLRVLLKGYRDDLREAEAELSVNPLSSTARRAKADAEAQIATITQQLRELCK